MRKLFIVLVRHLHGDQTAAHGILRQQSRIKIGAQTLPVLSLFRMHLEVRVHGIQKNG